MMTVQECGILKAPVMSQHCLSMAETDQRLDELNSSHVSIDLGRSKCDCAFHPAAKLF